MRCKICQNLLKKIYLESDGIKIGINEKKQLLAFPVRHISDLKMDKQIIVFTKLMQVIEDYFINKDIKIKIKKGYHWHVVCDIK